jgi:hypothetical protein
MMLRLREWTWSSTDDKVGGQHGGHPNMPQNDVLHIVLGACLAPSGKIIVSYPLEFRFGCV